MLVIENYLLISKITPQTLDQYWSTTCLFKFSSHQAVFFSDPTDSRSATTATAAAARTATTTAATTSAAAAGPRPSQSSNFSGTRAEDRKRDPARFRTKTFEQKSREEKFYGDRDGQRRFGRNLSRQK